MSVFTPDEHQTFFVDTHANEEPQSQSESDGDWRQDDVALPGDVLGTKRCQTQHEGEQQLQYDALPPLHVRTQGRHAQVTDVRLGRHPGTTFT